jgi:alpha-amylase
MGFTAIQISPVVKNIEEHTSVGDAYHGYWSQDNYALNEHFGTEQDFKDLVAEVHKRDMLLMLDVVVNNMAQAFDNVVPPKLDYSKFNPFNDEKYFHPYCNVTDWEDPENYQNCWFYPYGVALADLNTESDAVSDELNSWVKGLVANYSIDGIRIDAAKHVNDEFLPAFVEASGVFALGEVLTGVTQDMCRYQTLGLLPGMPNYLEYYPLLEAFNGGTFENVTRIRDEAATGCNDTLALGSFIENHDMPRFASRTEDLALAKNAMTYILLTDGIPTGKFAALKLHCSCPRCRC